MSNWREGGSGQDQGQGMLAITPLPSPLVSRLHSDSSWSHPESLAISVNKKARKNLTCPGEILPHFYPSHMSVGQITRKLGFSATHWLSWPIRGLGKIWYAQWITGKILPYFDPSHLSVVQMTRKLGFSASHWLFQPIRGLGDLSHVWDHNHWIPGPFLPHFDPSHLSVGQITRGLHSIYWHQM